MNSITTHGLSEQPSMSCWTPAYGAFLTRQGQIFRKAIEVLGKEELAQRWMINPALGLGNHTPCTLLWHEESYAQVWAFLYRLEYDVYT